METASGPLVPRRGGRLYLALEFTLLFVVIPTWLWFERHSFGQRIIPSLVAIGLACLVLLLADRSFDRSQLGARGQWRAGLRLILRRLLIGVPLLAVATYLFEGDLWLRFPREQPQVWLLVMAFYPLFSVYPQELIFRAFLFHRYRALFARDRSQEIVSALAFGWAHLFFANALAPLLSAVGGWLFARTYRRTRSTVLATVDHGIWGDVLFTVGLGWYFYGGSIPN